MFLVSRFFWLQSFKFPAIITFDLFNLNSLCCIHSPPFDILLAQGFSRIFKCNRDAKVHSVMRLCMICQFLMMLYVVLKGGFSKDLSAGKSKCKVNAGSKFPSRQCWIFKLCSLVVIYVALQIGKACGEKWNTMAFEVSISSVQPDSCVALGIYPVLLLTGVNWLITQPWWCILKYCGVDMFCIYFFS